MLRRPAHITQSKILRTIRERMKAKGAVPVAADPRLETSPT